MTFKVLFISVSVIAVGAAYINPRELTYYEHERKQSVKLYGNIHGYAYWYTDLLVGTPPQRTSVIVDTGSSVCAFACSVCENCGSHIDSSFDYGASSTASWSSCSVDCPSGSCRDDHCAYSINYSEGSSVAGYWFTDVVQLGDSDEANIPLKSYLGCHTSETKLFYSQSASGILGLAPGTNSKFPTILSSLFSDERIDKRVFSLCLSHHGGELTVGGHPGNTSELVYIAMKTETFYTINVSEVRVGTSVIGSTFAAAIVDSGTTLTYFPPEVYKRLTEVIEASIGGNAQKVGTRCWSSENSTIDDYPSIAFGFPDGQSVEWRPSSYMYTTNNSTLCYAFSPSDNSKEIILGASFFIGKNIVFDLGAATLGLQDMDCPSYTERPPLETLPTTTTILPTEAVEPVTVSEIASVVNTPPEAASELLIPQEEDSVEDVLNLKSLPVSANLAEESTVSSVPSYWWLVWTAVGILAVAYLAVFIYHKRKRINASPGPTETERFVIH